MYPASSFGDILGTFFGRGDTLLRRENDTTITVKVLDHDGNGPKIPVRFQ
jgi:hypothetical protein